MNLSTLDLPEGVTHAQLEEEAQMNETSNGDDGGGSDAPVSRRSSDLGRKYARDDEDDSDVVETMEARRKRKAPVSKTRANANKKKKTKKAEGLSSEEDEDDDYLGEGDAELPEDRRDREMKSRTRVSTAFQ